MTDHHDSEIMGLDDGRTVRRIDIGAGRRAFLKSIGFASAGLATLGTIGLSATPAEARTTTDVDILNFALNLEYLEAEFYLRAHNGEGLPAADVSGKGRLGAVIGGKEVRFETKAIAEYAREIAADERAHVRFLRKGLGSARVARPQIDLRGAFTAAARAAGLVGAGASFDAFANETNFLLAAFIFEDVGVTAYKGAATLLDNKDLLNAAAGILAVEAYHAATVRTLLYSRGLVDAVQAISDLRDSADGTGDRDQGIRRKGFANLVPADVNGLAYSRSAAQVLKIVYLGGDDKGGFFPRGLNGTIA